MKLHSAGPPDTTRHGATSEKPLFSIVMSRAGHFCARTGALASNSKTPTISIRFMAPRVVWSQCAGNVLKRQRSSMLPVIR